MNPRLEGYATAVLGAADTATVARVAEELASVDRLFTDNDTLRAALIDTALPSTARQAVIEDLLASRVSAETTGLVRFAAGAVGAAEITAALSWLAHRAQRAARGTEAPPEVLGHIAARERVGGFSMALFEALDVPELEEMEDELFRLGRTIETNPALLAALVDRDLPTTVRWGVVEDLIAGKVQPATLRLVGYLMEAGRPRDILGTIYWLVDRVAEARGWRVARVVAAREVADAERVRLGETLTSLVGRPVELQVTIDEALLAGVRVRIGDLQVDASARGRIEALRDHMNTITWQDRGFTTRGAGVARDVESSREGEGAN